MFSSFRRHYLDLFLSRTEFRGDVLDVGGKKEGKKGTFRPPLEKCSSWRYVNIDPATGPDFLASADALPIKDATADLVLLAETIEHLEFPEKALAEAHRVLRPCGTLVLTVPFLFPVHADPHDFQRWAPEKFRRVLGGLGFQDVKVEPMGGLLPACFDIFEGYCQAHYLNGRPLPLSFRVARALVRRLWRMVLTIDQRAPFKLAVTGGYFVTARKP